MSVELSPSELSSGKTQTRTGAPRRHINAGQKEQVKSHGGHAGQPTGLVAQGPGIFLSWLAIEKQRTAQVPSQSGFSAYRAGTAAGRSGAANSPGHGETTANAAVGETGLARLGAITPGRSSTEPIVLSKHPPGVQTIEQRGSEGAQTVLSSRGRGVLTGTSYMRIAVRGPSGLGLVRAESGLARSNLATVIDTQQTQRSSVRELAVAGSGVRSHASPGSDALSAAPGSGSTAALKAAQGNGSAAALKAAQGNGSAAALKAAPGTASPAALLADRRSLQAPMVVAATGSRSPLSVLTATAQRTAGTASTVGAPASASRGVASVQNLTFSASHGRGKPINALSVRGASQAARLLLRGSAAQMQTGFRKAGARGQGKPRIHTGVPAGAPAGAQESIVTPNATMVPPGVGGASVSSQFHQGRSHTSGSLSPGEGSLAAANANESSGLAVPALQSLLMQRFAPDVAGWLMRQSAQMLGSGFSAIELTLVPGHLGKLRVTVTGDKVTGLRVRFALANQEAQSLVQSQLPELRQLLHAGGYGSVAIDVGADSGHSSLKGEQNHKQPLNAHALRGSVSIGRSESPYAAQRDFDHAGFTARA